MPNIVPKKEDNLEKAPIPVPEGISPIKALIAIGIGFFLGIILTITLILIIKNVL